MQLNAPRPGHGAQGAQAHPGCLGRSITAGSWSTAVCCAGSTSRCSLIRTEHSSCESADCHRTICKIECKGHRRKPHAVKASHTATSAQPCVPCVGWTEHDCSTNFRRSESGCREWSRAADSTQWDRLSVPRCPSKQADALGCLSVVARRAHDVSAAYSARCIVRLHACCG